MHSRLIAPAFDRKTAIDLSRFIDSIICAEQAINNTVFTIKHDLFNKLNGGSA